MSTEFDTARQVVAASVFDECSYPDSTALDPADHDDVLQALNTVEAGATAEAEIALEGIYTLSIAAVADSRELRITARRKVSNILSTHWRYFIYDDLGNGENERLFADATADDPRVRAGAIGSLRWLAPYTSSHIFSSDTLSTLVEAVFDELSGEHLILRRCAGLSAVAATDSDSIRTQYSGEIDDFREDLLTAVKDSDPYVRGHALSCLECPNPGDDLEGFNTVINAYLTALSDDTDPNRRTVLDALSTTPIAQKSRRKDVPSEVFDVAPQVVRSIDDCLHSSSPVVRRRAADLLYKFSYPLTEGADNDPSVVTEIQSLGETATELPSDSETDRKLIFGFSTLIESYPTLSEPSISVAERVFQHTSNEQIPETYTHTRSGYMREKAVKLLQDVVQTAPETDLPMDHLYVSLAHPSELVREKVGSLLAVVADQSPESLNSCRDVGLILNDHRGETADDAESTWSADPLVIVAEHSPDEAAKLSQRLLSQTSSDDVDATVELLQRMAEFAPEAVEPVLEDAT